MKPILYMIDGCMECYKAKQHLTNLHYSFIEKNIISDPKASFELKKLIGEINTPVFVDDHVLLKGRDILFIGDRWDFDGSSSR
ncbi:hypothetical protein KUV80_03980 [Fictibacillus nanhaiensis]|uniref:glutaredoxin domain-containing protein n=1 Tax=Fictibacillus nanhaiensis TaxID=742169 RepID=UPI001C93AF4A|nr:glutaredoxin domain-containing protein [Fictibacillus nanhaiensis]MBY6035793.1 hypothetical protein [Fictibacillus nanhaiensis]